MQVTELQAQQIQAVEVQEAISHLAQAVLA
jgi:hypothetical protein